MRLSPFGSWRFQGFDQAFLRVSRDKRDIWADHAEIGKSEGVSG